MSKRPQFVLKLSKIVKIGQNRQKMPSGTRIGEPVLNLLISSVAATTQAHEITWIEPAQHLID